MVEIKKKKKEQDPNKLNRATTNELAINVVEFIEKTNLDPEQQLIVLRRAVKIKLKKRAK